MCGDSGEGREQTSHSLGSPSNFAAGKRKAIHGYLFHPEEGHSREQRVRSCLMLSSNSLQIQLICNFLKTSLERKENNYFYHLESAPTKATRQHASFS